jgi:hypothetical protein
MEHFQVRIRNAMGSIVGAGFLVAHERVVTCAHVVAKALATSDAAAVNVSRAANAPDGEVNLDFPFFAEAGSYRGRIIHWRAVQPRVDVPAEGGEDLAVLELTTPPLKVVALHV